MASPRPGRLYVSNFRLLWEADDGSVADATPTEPPSAWLVSLTVHSIERCRRLNADLQLVSAMEKLRKQASKLRDKIEDRVGGSTGVAPPVDGSTTVLEIMQKYNARPSLRVVLPETEYVRFVTIVRGLISTPSTNADSRANMAKCYALVHGAAVRGSNGHGSGNGHGSHGDSSSSSSDAFVFDVEREFHRQGLHNPLSHWRVSTINAKFELCPTYPSHLVVPRSISDDDLRRVAAFRSSGRLPVLCWKDPYGVSSICRSSQPLVGVGLKARSAHDEAIIQAITDTNPFVDRLQIVDCRPRVNAEFNAARGKGYEHQAQYPTCRLTFMNIENIHAMRASLRGFLGALQPKGLDAASAKDDDTWLSDLEKTGWFEHIRKILRTSAQVVQWIAVERSNVLVHCSDGWDRTAQVAALAQLLLDSHFRTRAGFQRLITKDWLHFGHQFALRCGTLAPLERGSSTPSEEMLSPTFLQFVECVWHISQQFPTAFEFNSRYLIDLLHHVMSCEHGTFLCNCERQRVALSLESRTTSAWAALASDEYVNPDFVVDDAVLEINLAGYTLRPWVAYYCRGCEAMALEPQTRLEDRCTQLARENERLRTELAEARAMIQKGLSGEDIQ